MEPPSTPPLCAPLDTTSSRMSQPTRISTTFFPSAVFPHLGLPKPDIIIQAMDGVHFYVHELYLKSASSNDLGNLLATPDTSASATSSRSSVPFLTPGSVSYFDQAGSPYSTSPTMVSRSPMVPTYRTLFAAEYSTVFNIVLHLVYGISCDRYGPDVDTLSEVLTALPGYGFKSPEPSSEFWVLLLNQAPLDPLRVFSIGANPAMESVCCLASQYTLTIPLSALTESDALTTGALYLRRLFFLHLGRLEALKRIIKAPPEQHPPTATCSLDDQRPVLVAWRLAICNTLMEDLPQNTAASALVATFAPVASVTTCPPCKASVLHRVTEIMQEWAMVRRTI